LPRSETPSFGTSPLFARSSSPCGSCDATRVVHPSLVSRFACARGRQEVFDTEVCNLNSDARARTDVRARCPFPAPDCRPVHVERLCPCGRPTRESHVDLRRRAGHALRHAMTSLYAFSRVSRPRWLLLRACITLATGRCAPSFLGALRTSTELTTISPCAARFRIFRRVAERPAVTSWRATWAEVCETKDPCAPTPRGSGNGAGAPPRGGPEHPLSSPRVRVWLEGHARLGDANPERPRSLFAPPPAKEEAFPRIRVLGTVP